MRFLSIIILMLGMQSVAFSQWTQLSNYSGGATDGAPTFVIDGKAYLGGGVGSEKLYEYNADNDSWLQRSDIPGGINRGWAFGFSINGKGYIGGGDHTGSFDLTADFREYDPATDTWTKKADFGGGARDGVYACEFNGKGYTFGGFNGSYAVNDVWEYNPETDIWTQKADYPGGQSIFPVGFVIDDKIYVGTGSPSGMAGTVVFYEYTPATDTWIQKANFPGAARQACISFEMNGKGYIGGGEANYSATYNDFFEYDPQSNSWSLVKNLDFPSAGSTAWCSSFVLGNNVYVGLGANFNGGTLNYSNKFFKIIFQ